MGAAHVPRRDDARFDDEERRLHGQPGHDELEEEPPRARGDPAKGAWQEERREQGARGGLRRAGSEVTSRQRHPAGCDEVRGRLPVREAHRGERAREKARDVHRPEKGDRSADEESGSRRRRGLARPAARGTMHDRHRREARQAERARRPVRSNGGQRDDARHVLPSAEPREPERELKSAHRAAQQANADGERERVAEAHRAYRRLTPARPRPCPPRGIRRRRRARRAGGRRDGR